MCEPASMIVTKDKVFWSKSTESHHEIREEFGLPDGNTNRVYNVQVEICPEDGDLSIPLKKWRFNVDQDRLPGWWDAEKAEKMCRLELKKWAKAKLVLAGNTRDVNDGDQVYVDGGTIQSVYGGTIQYVYGGTIHRVYGGTIHRVYGGTIQYVYGGTIQYVYGGTIQYVRGGTIQYVRGGTIHRVDGGTIQSVYGGTIQYVRGGTIQSVEGGSVTTYTKADKSILKSKHGVLIDRSGDVVKCYVGKDNP